MPPMVVPDRARTLGRSVLIAHRLSAARQSEQLRRQYSELGRLRAAREQALLNAAATGGLSAISESGAGRGGGTDQGKNLFLVAVNTAGGEQTHNM